VNFESENVTTNGVRAAV